MKLTEETIKKMVQSGEGYHLDFKLSVPTKVREIAEEVCSFANADGGYIFIGVDNENRIVGCKIDNNRRSALQDSINAISPSILCDIYSVSVDNKEIWVMSIPSGTNKPYIYGGSLYVRQGANAQMLRTREEMLGFFRECNSLHYDDKPARDVNLLAELDQSLFSEFCIKAGISPFISKEQVLTNLHAFDESTGFPKAGSVLFFAREPETHFPQAWIHCVRFRGQDNVFIQDDKRYRGPLYQQYLQALDWLKDKLDLRIIIDDGGPHKEVLELPEDALREALINSLCHRDYYETGAVIVVALYDDRLVISNPGGLLPQVAESFGHKSLSRNPYVFSLFTRMLQVEQVGSGIPRMRQLMREMNLPEPTFIKEGIFSITFMRNKKEENYQVSQSSEGENKNTTEKTTGKTTEKIVAIIGNNPHATITLMAKLIGITRRNVEKNLKILKERGIIKHVGPDKGGHWEIIKTIS